MQKPDAHVAGTNDVGSADIGPTKCPYCDGPIVKTTRAHIIDRGYDNRLRRQYVRHRDMDFCSSACASSFQMGQEG